MGKLGGEKTRCEDFMNVSSQIKKEENSMTLEDIKENQEIKIVDIFETNERVKKHLHAYGLTNGRTVKVISTHPEVIIQIEETELALEHSVARKVHVSLL
jgi:Fe2+ transport system protein FeoA